MEINNDVKISDVSNFMTFEPMHLNVMPKKQNLMKTKNILKQK